MTQDSQTITAEHIDCAEKCEIPAGMTMTKVPTPRHAWPDIVRCPNCGDCFLIRAALNQGQG